jgi:hypothetical protein
MSPFPHILPAVQVAQPQGEQNPAGFSGDPKNLPGVFEKMMTELAPGTTPKEQIQPVQLSQAPVQSKEIPQNFSNKMVEQASTPLQAAVLLNSAQAIHTSLPIGTKTTSLNSAASDAPKTVSKASHKDKNFPAPAETANAPANPEAFLNQIFAVPVLTVNPIGNSGRRKTPEASGDSATPSSQGGVAELNSVLPAPVRTNPVSATTTKVSSPQLSISQLTPTIEANTAATQQASALTAKDAALPAKNIGPTAPGQAMPAAAAAFKSSSPELPENQTAINLTNSAVTPASANTTAKDSDANAATVTPPQAEANGTSIAKQDVAMKQAEKTNKIAGQTEKVLPGNVVSAARENQSSGISLNTQSIMATATADSPASASVNGVSSLSADSVAASAAANARANTLERTQELVTVSAVRLSDSGNNSMQVVIKPDAGTQLSLELRQQGGNVEVQAVLQQGDFNHLNQQWPDLQQRLDERGIRLAPLTDDGASGSNNSGGEAFQNKQNQTNGVVPELSLVNSPAGRFTPEAAQTSTHRGWETWA